MLIAIIIFPLFSGISLLLFGSKIGRRGSWYVSLVFALLPCILSVYGLGLILANPNYLHQACQGTWFKSGALYVEWTFLFDGLSLIMCFIISTIAFLVQIFSIGYMKSDPSLPRFLSYLSLFSFFMLTLVTSNNLIVLFFGWEGIGICSFLLISFWNTRIPAIKAALKALIVNRVGDFFFLAATSLIFLEFKTVNFLPIQAMVPFFVDRYFTINLGLPLEIHLITLISFFLLIASFGKSAQIGLHIWLPDAMEGPTPVSALLHAATMVTAGVFLILRCSLFFEFAPSILQFMVFFGSFTSIFAALCGAVETDIKKIIAYSTCSQLGYIVCACGLSSYKVALFHLFNHAFFKALLFLCAGAVIHAASNEQNIKRMGGLAGVLPFTTSCMLIGLLSLNAFPYTSGFYSKEAILGAAYVTYGGLATFAYWSGLITCFLTSYYSYRLFFFVFLSETNLHKPVALNLQEEGFFTIIPLSVLTVFSIFSGYWFKDVFLGFGSNFFDYSLQPLPSNLKQVFSEFLPARIKILPLIASFLGWGCINPVTADSFLKFKFVNFYNLLKNEWFINTVVNSFLLKLFFKSFVFGFYKINEILHLLGPKGVQNLFICFSTNIKKLHSGQIYQYFCFMSLNLCLIFFFFVNF